MSDQIRTLSELPNSKSAQIRELSGDQIIVQRLKEIGFVTGEDVSVVGRALFGEPIMVEVRGAVVALRSEEAACVKI